MTTRTTNAIFLLGTMLTGLFAGWLIVNGLQLRFFGGFVTAGGLLGPPSVYPRWVGALAGAAQPNASGWPLVVIGCSLFGALGGLWKRQAWSLPALRFFSGASLITLHWLNVIPLLVLILSFSPLIGRWLAYAEPD